MAGRWKAVAAGAAVVSVGLLGFGATAASAGEACPPAGHSGVQVCPRAVTPEDDPVVDPVVDPAVDPAVDPVVDPAVDSAVDPAVDRVDDSAGGLPITGADVLGLAVLGSAAVLTGGLVLRATRRSSQPA
jgi:hypothetical protein